MIPVIIIAYNQLTYIRNMVLQCLPIAEKIYIIDNASTYLPLINYYQNELPNKVELVRNPENGGHLIWEKYLHLFPEEYIVTDPDLLFNPEMPNNVINILSNLGKKFNAKVIGLALNISDALDFTDAKHCGVSIYDWESKLWQNKIQSDPEEVYFAAIDTTFALHSKSNSRSGSLRVAGKFTCKHIPWYRRERSPLPIPIEEKIAFQKNNRSTNWKLD